MRGGGGEAGGSGKLGEISWTELWGCVNNALLWCTRVRRSWPLRRPERTSNHQDQVFCRRLSRAPCPQ